MKILSFVALVAVAVGDQHARHPAFHKAFERVPTFHNFQWTLKGHSDVGHSESRGRLGHSEPYPTVPKPVRFQEEHEPYQVYSELRYPSPLFRDEASRKLARVDRTSHRYENDEPYTTKPAYREPPYSKPAGYEPLKGLRTEPPYSKPVYHEPVYPRPIYHEPTHPKAVHHEPSYRPAPPVLLRPYEPHKPHGTYPEPPYRRPDYPKPLNPANSHPKPAYHELSYRKPDFPHRSLHY